MKVPILIVFLSGAAFSAAVAAPHPLNTRITPTPSPTPTPTLRGVPVPKAVAVATPVPGTPPRPAPSPRTVNTAQKQSIAQKTASVPPRPPQRLPTPTPTPTPAPPIIGSQQPMQIPLVDIKKTEPTIVVDLRYATPENFTHHVVYPADTRALIRPEVMERLVNAQRYLRRYEFNLKIWDAYRPRWAQIELWKASPKNDYVANPAAGAGSLHSWGLAVDATLADRYGGSVRMPTEFDDFTPAAMWKYNGPNDLIRRHLALLQSAMAQAGFYGVRSEWWHFTSEDWQQLMPPDEAKRALQAFSQAMQQQTKL